MAPTNPDESARPESSTEPRPVNRLDRESSAYLRQHRFNPVDWVPWGDEALDRAQAEDKPLLVSIGYSACHWCHVMERESFEDPEIARLMNESFVCIKVDREERPDVDQIYMETSLKLNGSGGWPLNAICTPDGRPFFVGTYFPPVRRGETPSFREVLEALTNVWQTQRDEVETNASQLAEVLAAQPEGRSEIEPGPDTIQNAAKLIMKGADRIHGGFGGAPKFPTPTNLEFLITALDFLPHEEASDYARFLAFTAREMARRGLFDQLGGGFHRYCTDPQWTIPHFEKMLYDQGQMISFYAELVRRAHDASDLLWPIQETVAYLRREMRGEGGAFFASQDADSEGVEGKFFVWTPGQIANVLGDEADPFCTYYGVRLAGNFEDGTTHLIDEARAPREELQAAREILRGVREERIAPETDRKHVAAWNGYVISGLARAAAALEDDTLRRDAVQAADFVLQEMVDEDGRLLRVHNEGQAHTLAFLDDHASLLAAFLDLYRAGGGDRFLAAAQWIAQETLSRFADRDRGVLYLSPTGGPGDRLIHRPRSEQDGATPDAAGLAVLGLARLAALSEDAETAAFVDRALEERGLALEQAPHAFPTLLRAVALRARGLAVAVIVGAPEDAATQALAHRARRVLRPEDAVVVVAPGQDNLPGLSETWLAGRTAIDDRATAYLCRGTMCSLPIHEPQDLIDDGIPGA